MAHVSGNEMKMARYATPTFDPRGAFARTLRGGEIARLEARRQRNGLPDRKELEARGLAVAGVNGTGLNMAQPRRYETPTFEPRGAFARTLRGGEIALLERLNRLSELRQPNVLFAC